MNSPADKLMVQGRIKQRLVGAVVLIALGVIIIPMLIDFRKDYDQVITGSNIPPKPNDFRVEVLPLNNEPSDVVPDIEQAPAPQAVVVSGPEAAEKKSPSPPLAGTNTASVAVPAVSTVPAPAAWVIQVGSFSSEENAQSLRDRLRKKGYTAFIDKVAVDGKQSYRVAVGPELKRARAEGLQKKLVKEMDISGIIVNYR